MGWVNGSAGWETQIRYPNQNCSDCCELGIPANECVCVIYELIQFGSVGSQVHPYPWTPLTFLIYKNIRMNNTIFSFIIILVPTIKNFLFIKIFVSKLFPIYKNIYINNKLFSIYKNVYINNIFLLFIKIFASTIHFSLLLKYLHQ